MRIWILSTEIISEVAGGIARYIDNFIRLLGKSGNEVVLISRSSRAIDRDLYPGVRLIGVDPDSSSLDQGVQSSQHSQLTETPNHVLDRNSAFSFQMAATAIELATYLPLPDIIESQEYSALPYFLIQRRLTERTALSGVPLLLHLHNSLFNLAFANQEPRYRFPQYWTGQMEKFCIYAADAILSPSHYLSRSIKTQLGIQSAIKVIPYPMADTALPATTTQPTRRHIVYVGRLQLIKGVLPMLDGCDRLWRQGRNFELSLVGGDTFHWSKGTSVGAIIRHKYRHWIESGCLKLMGEVPHGETMRLMREAWAVVVPSLVENFPNTCIEAMAAGQVVLASTSGGQSEMVGTDNLSGFLFGWNQKGSFEEKLGRVLDLGNDERVRIGARASHRIRALCNPEDILKQRLSHYRKVIRTFKPKNDFPLMPLYPSGYEAATGVNSPRFIKSENQSQQQGSRSGMLSVIIPYYNLGRYLSQTIDSIISANYSPMEIIVVNDGSTDAESLDALNHWRNKGVENLHIIDRPNKGLSSTRNYGVECAIGEFVAFVDADDQVEANFFSRAIDVLQRYANVGFVYSWLRYFDNSEGLWPTWNSQFPYLLGHNLCSALVVVRRSAFLKDGRNNAEMAYSLEDHESWIAMTAAGWAGVSLPEPLARYRVRPDSMFHSSNEQQQLYLYDLMTCLHPDLFRAWGSELFNLQNANGPGFLWKHPSHPSVSLHELNNKTVYYQHCLSHLIEKIQNEKIEEIFICGAGEAGQALLKGCQEANLEVVGVIDKNESLWGKMIGDVLIMGLTASVKRNPHNYAIGSFAFGEEIRQEILRAYAGTEQSEPRIFIPSGIGR